MVDNRTEDDLFRHTSMSFGEHLEELRSALFKSVVALVIGFSIGLFFGSTIVRLIQSPLEKALGEYYTGEAIEFIDARLPKEMRTEETYKRVREQGLIPSVVYVSPAELAKQLTTTDPQLAKELGGIAPSRQATAEEAAESGVTPIPEGMLRMITWRLLDDDERLKLESFNVQESFMIWLKAAFLAGAVLSCPFVFYFLWNFVAAGLYPHEKKYVHLFLPISLGLFLAGVALAFVWVFPPVLNFFFGVNKSMGQVLRPRITDWVSFVLLLPLGFGIAFQLPLVMLFLERIQIFTVSMYQSRWKISVLIMSVVAMVLSPGGDPWSMMFMFVPLVLLYFAGIWLCKWLPPVAGKKSTEAGVKAYAAVD